MFGKRGLQRLKVGVSKSCKGNEKTGCSLFNRMNSQKNSRSDINFTYHPGNRHVGFTSEQRKKNKNVKGPVKTTRERFNQNPCKNKRTYLIFLRNPSTFRIEGRGCGFIKMHACRDVRSLWDVRLLCDVFLMSVFILTHA